MTVDAGCRIVAFYIGMHTQKIHEENDQAHDNTAGSGEKHFLLVAD